MQLLRVKIQLVDDVLAGTAGDMVAEGFPCLVDEQAADVTVVTPDASDGK